MEEPILMIGDSLIAYGNWDELLGCKVINRGMGGDTTNGVCQRISVSLLKHPKKIFIMTGINDLITGEGVSYIMRCYRKLLNRIKDQSPQSEVYIHKVLPANRDKLLYFFDKEQARSLNKAIEEMANELEVTCIDLGPLLLEKDELKARYTSDGVHLNEEAYGIWAAYLKNRI